MVGLFYDTDMYMIMHQDNLMMTHCWRS